MFLYYIYVNLFIHNIRKVMNFGRTDITVIRQCHLGQPATLNATTRLMLELYNIASKPFISVSVHPQEYAYTHNSN